MGVASVVIVGRPNVGKSSVFNWITGKQIAIVDDTPGVTRDRVTFLVNHKDRYFELVDTGGVGFEDPDQLTEHINEQIELALSSAAVVLLVTDTRAGRLPLDEELAKRLRQLPVPVICVANKTDHAQLDAAANEFYGLTKGPLVRVSAQQHRGVDELLDTIYKHLPPEPDATTQLGEPVMKLAIVGRPNTGKSTFVNTLAKARRMIVSEVPGTTRDSVDVRFELDGKPFIAIDTPGIKRATQIKTDVGFYSLTRARRSIRRADVVLVFFDASQRIAKADKQLCQYVAEEYKPCIFVVNKWDLYAGSMPTEKWANYLRDSFRTMAYVPIAFITGATGKNVKALINHAQMLFKQSLTRVSTAQINKVLRAALEHSPPPMYHGKRPKIYYATQVAVQPPTIVLICNHPAGFSETYRRYLLNVFRDNMPFGEVPIKLYLRKRDGGQEPPQDDWIERD